MKKNLGEIRTSVDRITRQRWTTTQLNEFINSAYDEICSMGEFDFLRKEADIVATATQTVFDYPADFRKAELLYLNDASSADDGEVYTQENHFINISINTTNGKRRFQFHSAPGGNLKLRYYYNPAPLRNDEDIPIIPEFLHRLIEVKASLQALRVDNRDKAQIQLLDMERNRKEGMLMGFQQSKPTSRKLLDPTGVNGEPIQQYEPLGDGY